MIKILSSLAIALMLACFMSCRLQNIACFVLASVLQPLANRTRSFASHVVVVHVEDRKNRATPQKPARKNQPVAFILRHFLILGNGP